MKGEYIIVVEAETETLRDKIAMAAMNGLLSADWTDEKTVATRAYVIADEMLKARLNNH